VAKIIILERMSVVKKRSKIKILATTLSKENLKK